MTETNLGDDLEDPLARLFEKLEMSRRRSPSTELRNFVHMHALDTYRLGITLRPIIDAARATPTVPALAVELLVRNVVEAAITCLYVIRNPEETSVHQVITTSAKE